MKNLLFIVFFLFVLFSFGIPDTGQDNKSCSDIYSLVSEIPEIMEKGDTQSGYEDRIDLTSLNSCILPGTIRATDTRQQFSYDRIRKIFQPPR